MKLSNFLSAIILMVIPIASFAQVQIDKQLQMTGGTNTDRQITGVGDPGNNNDAVNVNAIQRNSVVYAQDNGTANAYSITLSPAPSFSSYQTGMIVHFRANNANTGTSTLSVNGMTATPIFKNYNTALTANDIKAGQIVSVMFDGANFQMLSQAGNAAATGNPCSVAPSTPGAITGSASACIKNPAVYSISPVAGATSYNWSVPSNATLISGQGTTSITVIFANTSATVSVSVTASNSCGTSASSSLSVTTGDTWSSSPVTTYSSAGTFSFTVPSCADHICIELWGGGGGGGGGNNNTGGGGGGGGYGKQCFYSAPGTVHTVIVGTGGNGGGPNTVGGDGNPSSVGALISATGGKGGKVGPQGLGGAGGTSTATTNANGGTGGQGSSSCFGGTGGAGGGSGGGSGGSGGACDNANGGNAPGGGGGGVGSNSGYSGGPGAVGRVIFSW